MTSTKSDKAQEKPRIYHEVIRGGLCRACGACVAVCPTNAIRINRNTAIVTDACINCGACERVCPVFVEDNTNSDVLGDFIEIKAAQQPKFEICQDGGTTSFIMEELLKKDKVDCIVAVGKNDNWEAEPVIITSIEELNAVRGVTYTYTPLLPKVKEAVEKYDRVAVVGVGCQITAAYNFKHNRRKYKEKIKYLIGIVCTKSFKKRAYYKYLQEQGVEIAVCTKFNVTRGKFNVFDQTGKKIFSTSIKNIVPFGRNGCGYCSDVVSYKADITVGSVGSEVFYNTIIVRTEKGKELWDEIKAELNLIEPDADRLRKLVSYKIKEVNKNFKKLKDRKNKK